jgi:hypothetical protein
MEESDYGGAYPSRTVKPQKRKKKLKSFQHKCSFCNNVQLDKVSHATSDCNAVYRTAGASSELRLSAEIGKVLQR